MKWYTSASIMFYCVITVHILKAVVESGSQGVVVDRHRGSMAVRQQSYTMVNQYQDQSSAPLDVTLNFLGGPSIYYDAASAGLQFPQAAFSPTLSALGDTAEIAAAQATEIEIIASETSAIWGSLSLGLTVIFIVATVTMPYWLPLLLRESGVANNTLYEASSSIVFQGEMEKSCNHAYFHFYPYNRKDLNGRFWQEVGGDRGRSCLPERYYTTVYIPCRTLITIQGSKKDHAKHMSVFGFGLGPENHLAIAWNNA